MTASRTTIIQFADIFDEYLLQERYDYECVAARLKMITGSKSVTETCELLAKELMERAPSR